MRVTVPVEGSASTTSKLIVRGDRECGYHNDVVQRTVAELRVSSKCVEALGGGRIEHDEEAGCVSIFGYSMAFGPAVHEVSAAIVRQAYPWYAASAVSVNYEGY